MMIDNKRFRKVMGFIQDTTCEGGDVEGVMDLTEIEGMLNSLNDEKKELRIQYNFIREQSNEFHRIARENIDRVGQLEKENNELKKELDYYKNQHTDENVKWLRENTVWEQMPTAIKTTSSTSIPKNELSTENRQLKKENNKLKELLNLIAEAQSVKKEESVKEILRNEIKAIDTVTDESAQAWNDYCILCNFFEEQYNEKYNRRDDLE